MQELCQNSKPLKINNCAISKQKLRTTDSDCLNPRVSKRQQSVAEETGGTVGRFRGGRCGESPGDRSTGQAGRFLAKSVWTGRGKEGFLVGFPGCLPPCCCACTDGIFCTSGCDEPTLPVTIRWVGTQWLRRMRSREGWSCLAGTANGNWKVWTLMV